MSGPTPTAPPIPTIAASAPWSPAAATTSSAAARCAGRTRLLPVTDDTALVAGAHVVAADAGSDGHVSSACWSPALGGRIALAMLRDGRARHGEVVTVDDLGRRTQARIVPPVFVDPEGARLR